MSDLQPVETTSEYQQALQDGWLPIRDVARQTGVNAVTLRAWERRYGLIKPQRTPKGHRLYDQSHVVRIQHILTWLNRGVAVGQVSQLLESSGTPSTSEDSVWSEQRQQLQQALLQLNQTKLDEAFNRMLTLYPPATLLEHLLLPLLEGLEQRWQGQFGSQIERVFLHSWLHSKLAARVYHNNRQQHGQRLLLINLCENPLDPGLWLTAWLASGNQMLIDVFEWPVPLAELGLALDSMQPAALMFYACQTPDTDCLQRLASSSDVPLLLVGPAASMHADELDDIPGLSLAVTPLDALEQLQRMQHQGDLS